MLVNIGSAAARRGETDEAVGCWNTRLRLPISYASGSPAQPGRAVLADIE